MCGFAGYVGGSIASSEELTRMGGRLAHRGPDDDGKWVDEGRFGVVHRRLAVIDPSESGHQPMRSASRRFVLAFNGEIYNHQSLRERLPRGERWRGSSDTETLLAAFEEWGVTSTLERCVGMFAGVLWDSEIGEATFFRDRFGEKPLYFAKTDHGLLFASEVSAFEACAAFEPRVALDSVASLLRYTYLPSGRSIYSQVQQLPPACTAVVRGARAPKARSYWSPVDVANRVAGTRNDSPAATEELEQVLTRAVVGQLISDVPVGAFLSGGVDSTTLVALMRASGAHVRTYSIGFESEAHDESKFAAAIAQHLGTEHVELRVGEGEMLDVIPSLGRLYAEPFADASQIPTVMVSRIAREHVTVALSGDGGDEVFGGYYRHRTVRKVLTAHRRLPALARDAIRWGLSKLDIDRLPLRGRKAARAIAAKGASDLYPLFAEHWSSGLPLHPSVCIGFDTREANTGDGVLDFLVLDSLRYLPDDILTKVDRASMSASLETRAPFLDHRVAEFAWSLPADTRVSALEGKSILRRVLARHVPRRLWERPKMGFGVPLGDWLRGPLRDWAEELIGEHRLQSEEIFDTSQIRAAWRRHLEGDDTSTELWPVLMFQAWSSERNFATTPSWEAVFDG